MATTEKFIGIRKDDTQRVTRMAVQVVDGYLQLAIAGQSQFSNDRKYLVFEFRDSQLIMKVSKVELIQNSVISTETLKNESTELDRLFMKVVSSIIHKETFPCNYNAFDNYGQLSIIFYEKEIKVTLRFICDRLIEYIEQRVNLRFIGLTFKSNKYELTQEIGSINQFILN